MAVAHDAVTEFSATFTTTSPATQSHTPAGTPRGVVVEIDHGEVSTDLITGVTYGGVAMERVATAVDTTSEAGRVYLYFLGGNVPTGAQTVSITHTGTATVKHAAVATVTAATDTEVGSGMGFNNDAANPLVVVGGGTNSDGTLNTSLGYGVIYSGHDALTSLVELGGMVLMVDHDYGTYVSRFDRQAPLAGTFGIGYTALTEDLAFVGVSIREVDPAGAYIKGAIIPFLTNTTTSTVVGMGGQLADTDLYCFAISRDHASGTALATCTDNSGGNTWTLVSNDTDRKLNVWWKRGLAADVGATVTIAGAVGSVQAGIVFCKNTAGAGGDPTTNLTIETNAAADETHASITPTNPGSVVMFAVGDYANDTNAVTVLAGATMGTLEPELFEWPSSGGNDCRLTVTGRTLASGATGNITWTQVDATTKSVLFAVTPALTATVDVSAPTDTTADTPTSLVQAAQAFTVLPLIAAIDADVLIPEVITNVFVGIDAAIASTLPAAAQTSETGLTVQAWMG